MPRLWRAGIKNMDVKNLLKDVQNLTDYEFKQRLGKLVRENYKYRNLSTGNKKIVFDLVKKFRPYLRKGIGVSSYTVRKEMYNLHRKRIKLDLTKEDLKDIKEILTALQK